MSPAAAFESAPVVVVFFTIPVPRVAQFWFELPNVSVAVFATPVPPLFAAMVVPDQVPVVIVPTEASEERVVTSVKTPVLLAPFTPYFQAFAVESYAINPEVVGAAPAEVGTVKEVLPARLTVAGRLSVHEPDEVIGEVPVTVTSFDVPAKPTEVTVPVPPAEAQVPSFFKNPVHEPLAHKPTISV